MKTVGIIGGFGPEATAQFYLALVAACRKNFARQPNLMVRNVAVPQSLEQSVLLSGRRLDAFIPILRHAAQELEAAGADCVVFPCNTLHVHENHIRSAISIPFVSIIKSSTDILKLNHVRTVGLLGTRVTIEKNLFAKNRPSIRFVIPPDQVQKVIDTSLHAFVATGRSHALRKILDSALLHFVRLGVKDVLLACTDFHGMLPAQPGLTIHDTIDMLVAATIERLKQISEGVV